ncbi:hypothetical protein [Kitasatospora sp. NPDC094015]|uniref:hypothetical protein n=1 Tax=Kitasatospora sp. NPDC094015 TaxID=3155205 RepID=UPI003323D5CA
MGNKDSDTGSSDNDFTKGDDGALFGNPTGGGFHVHDYDVWDWQHIEAAIVGMSNAVSSASNRDQARSVADPQSLQDAADAFYRVQQVFEGVSQSLADQGAALAGKDGVWTGLAADSFMDMIKMFSKQVGAVGEVISGGGPGGNSVPQQLADNAVNLRNAQNKIIEIDNWYANQADQMGYHAIGSGLIPVSKAPGVVEMMNRDMRRVLKSLAAEYQVTVDSITSPGPVNSPLGAGGGGGGDQPNPADLAELKGLDGQGDAAARAALGPAPTLTHLDALGGPNPLSSSASRLGDGPGNVKTAVSPFGGGTGTGGSGRLGGLPSAAGELSGFGDPLGLDGPGALRSGALADALDPFHGGTGTGGTGGLDQGLTLPSGADPFTGGTGTGGLGRLGGPDGLGGLGGSGTGVPLPGAFPGGTGIGGIGTAGGGTTGIGTPGLGDSLGTADPGTWSPLPAPGAFPGGLGTGGVGNLGSGLTGTKPATFPGGLDTGGTGGLGSGATGGKPVGFPGDLTTSSGLPAGLPGPTSGAEFPGLGQAGLPFPGSLSTGGLGGAGMPFPPGLGGGAQPTATGSGERSDASGLLEQNAEPWAGTSDLGDDLGSRLGTVAGGEGLTLPGAHEPLAAGLGGAGMPFPPGLGGGAQPTATGGGERSDASGLLEQNAEPWTGTTDTGDDLDSRLGTLTGGEGLTLPGAHEPLAADLAGAGMPFPPGLGGGAQPTATGNGERSDASGLLEQNAEPWTAEADSGTSEAGTAAGGEGLTLPTEHEPAALDGAGTPYLPSSGTGAQPTATGSGERSDASGLLEENAEPWTAEADGGTSEAGTVTGGEGLTLPFLPAQTAPAQAAPAHERERDRRETAALVLPVAEAAALWGADAAAADPGDTPEEVPASGGEPEPVAVQMAGPVAVLPVVGEEDPGAAWDVAGAAFAPLLWAASAEEEADVTAEGPATADEGTWGAAATAEPSFATWQPNRTGEAAATPASVALAGAALACSTEDIAPDPEPEPAEAEEEAPVRGAADLLVQERDLWGASDTRGLDAFS